ncbi:hypothetical protein ACQ4PT_027957 [Festuca glaucescens]
MAKVQEQEETRKREERWDTMYRPQKSAEEYCTYVADAASVPPMCYTDNLPSNCSPRDSLQIVSIKIASIRGGLPWPIHVFGMVTARDVLDYRKRVIIYARARSNCQTITEEHPYLVLTGPTRAIVTCHDPGNIDIVLKVKGETESHDRDLSFLVLNLQSRGYCYFHGDYTSNRSTLELGFHHIDRVVKATISVRLMGGALLPPGDFQGVFTASTTSGNFVGILLLAFRDGKLPVADDGTINLSRRVVSVGYTREDQKDQLKVSIVARSAEHEQNATRNDIVFTPKIYGRSRGVFNLGTCKMQVTVAWSEFKNI